MHDDFPQSRCHRHYFDLFMQGAWKLRAQLGKAAVFVVGKPHEDPIHCPHKVIPGSQMRRIKFFIFQNCYRVLFKQSNGSVMNILFFYFLPQPGWGRSQASATDCKPVETFGFRYRQRKCPDGIKKYPRDIRYATVDQSQSRLESVATETSFLSVVFDISNHRDMVDFMIQFVVDTRSVVGSSMALASSGFIFLAQHQENTPRRLRQTYPGLPVFLAFLSFGLASPQRRFPPNARPFKSGLSIGRIP